MMRGTLFGRNRAEWFLVLEAMYDLQITLNPDDLFGDDRYANAEFVDQARKTIQIERSTHLDRTTIDKSINYLKDVDLVEEYENNDTTTYGLSNKGFQLVHQRKMQKHQERRNILLTIILIVLSFISIF